MIQFAAISFYVVSIEQENIRNNLFCDDGRAVMCSESFLRPVTSLSLCHITFQCHFYF